MSKTKVVDREKNGGGGWRSETEEGKSFFISLLFLFSQAFVYFLQPS